MRPSLFSSLCLFPLALAVGACPMVTGDDDDSSSDDDSAAGDDDDMAMASPVQDDLACDGQQVDVWTATIASGASITADVDTLAAETTFDPSLGIWNVAGPFNSHTGLDALVFADDTEPCAFPSASALSGDACPVIEDFISPGGSLSFVVGAWGIGCDGATAAYELTVFVDGAAALLTLAEDDAARAE